MVRLLKILFWTGLAVWGLVTGYVLVQVRERYGRGGPIPVSQAQFLLHPLRPILQPVRASLESFRIKAGDTVLEVGPGPGYFTLEAGRMVGEGGRVVCLDLQPGMLRALRLRLDEHGVDNAHPVLGDATKLPLADGSVAVAFLVAVLGEIPDRPAAVRELRRVLKPGGVLSICETLTDPDYQLEASVRDLCRASGFEVLDHARQRLGYVMSFRRP